MFDCGNSGCVEEYSSNNETSKARWDRRLQSVKTTTEWIQSRTRYRPKVAVICGSGFGSFADCFETSDVFDYSVIPHFVTCTVPGHAGRLVFGTLGGVEVVAMQGRSHAYEDHNMWQVTFPVRVLASIGVEILILTNASGSINPVYKVGDFVIVKDHINIAGLAGLNPLQGLCDDRFGPRFPCMVNAYDGELRSTAWRVGRQLGFESFMHDGISFIVCGPNYETPAELRMMRAMGADVVGMSTAPEVTVARQCNMRCFSLSLVTNVCLMSNDDASNNSTLLENSSDPIAAAEKGPDHDEVLSTGIHQANNIRLFLHGLIAEIATMIKPKTG